MNDANRWTPTCDEMPCSADGCPPWWHRVLWSAGCAAAAIAIGHVLLLLVGEVTQRFLPATDSLGDRFGRAVVIVIYLLYEITFAGLVGLFAGALYPGRIGFVATLVAHACGCLALSGFMLLAGAEFHIQSPFFFAAALLLGTMAFALWRITSATPSDAPFDNKPPSESS